MSSSPNHILVVEDHEDSAAMLARLLKRSGYEVSIARGVKEALTFITENADGENAVDLIVSDLGLPDGTGYELMQKAQEKFRLQGIALSGYGQTNDVKNALDAGFSAHLTKPLDFDRLKAAILDLVGKREAQF